ncbi:UNVERIFIED_CONTAM: hypothetical protein PYX00_001146 [Menopon gallinae]|uniref:Dynein regulatory complex protein 1/2 N-terminal domain-containing protein n=1 Tax=Menopon gallinae TaxID=328185 RepID=A0AAW2ICK2_9NEOP
MEDKKSLRKLNAEKRKKQIQMDFLKREQALDKETAKILKEKWFEILLRSKLPELKENLRNVLDYMEKLVEIEVFRKQLFEEQRVDASVQLNMQAQNHSRALNDLYALYLQRINDLHSIYTEQVMKKKEEAENEFKDMKRLGKKNDEGLKGILFQMEKNQVKKEDQMKCDMFLKTDDEKSKNAEKTESLRMRLERFMDKRWNQISNILADYQQTTEVRRNHYAQLKARDEKDAKIISSQMKKTKKLYDSKPMFIIPHHTKKKIYVKPGRQMLSDNR